MPDEPVGIGELSRKIEDFRRDVRDDFQGITNQLNQFVLREVYLADKQALQTRLERMEREADNARSAARTALYACLGTIVAAIVVAVVVRGGK